jgi:hypothetical protein
MKQKPIIMMSLSVVLFTTGCGQSHDDRQARRDVRQLSNDTAADMNCAAQDADHAAHDLTRAANAATYNAMSAVRQASLEVRDDIRQGSEGIPQVNPAQLSREVKHDAVDAAGAAAEEEAEKLLKLK